MTKHKALLLVIGLAVLFNALLVPPHLAAAPCDPPLRLCHDWYNDSHSEWWPGYGWVCAGTGPGCEDAYCC